MAARYTVARFGLQKPSLVETISPGRKVGSFFTSNEARPNASLPLQVQLATSCRHGGV